MKKQGDLLDAQVIEAVPEAGAEAMMVERATRHPCLDRGYATVACRTSRPGAE